MGIVFFIIIVLIDLYYLRTIFFFMITKHLKEGVKGSVFDDNAEKPFIEKK